MRQEDRTKKFIMRELGIKRLSKKLWSEEYSLALKFYSDFEIWKLVQKYNTDIVLFLDKGKSNKYKLHYYFSQLLSFEVSKIPTEKKNSKEVEIPVKKEILKQNTPPPYRSPIVGVQVKKRKTFLDIIEEYIESNEVGCICTKNE